ncbi:VCBS repeat-containing protein [Paraflavitalea sp. CAU 1676]|uniref:VCBS repeat-containing protein n=1 Tax=Paraflavitalea sp. CAU 1676 TaxID=3032598 RepID=UPI0023DA7BF2|nr:VCBS repeat-containing protein [Paraflavitalea sp. CAU 1676]MDF2190733.1 VCBS repeat-containing protein [Paraflavitalea sp. CAU 1676]
MSRINLRTAWIACLGYCLLLLTGCRSGDRVNAPLFEVLDHSTTGLHFANKLTQSGAINMLKYMYFYNGAGVGAGDFNNDGRIDLFFAANQQPNQLYLNEGKLQFKDVSAESKIPRDTAWSTGVSIADVNGDGLLDIYICRVGNYETLQSHNQLLICQKIENGIPQYKDQAKEYGLDFSGFSTQATFFDYDLDGDLDMYLLNHSLRYNSTFAPRPSYAGTYETLTGDRMFRNDNGHFTNVTREAGINSSIIGYGLGVAVADINLDGWPDLYIGNDFHENDYLYINQHNGTFRDTLTGSIMHTSQFSMGVDVADANNDAWPEVISVDMLPSDPYILKRSLGEDAYDVFYAKIKHGYNYQYARNALQYNRCNGQFSEVGLYAGVYATDWSWAPLWLDFDNDGLKDLFVSNGIPKRLNDIDYVNYISNDEIQRKIRAGEMQEKDMALINKFPEIKLPNRFFRNKGALSFEDEGKRISNDRPTYSNGALYADLDNDGDLDIVVNNIDEPALVYRNTGNDRHQQHYLSIELKGAAGNTKAIGAKAIVYVNGGIRTYEKFPVRGFLSSMEIPLQIGLDSTEVDSMFVIWPDNRYQPVHWTDTNHITLTYQPANLPVFDYSILTAAQRSGLRPAEEVTASTGLQYRHQENHFVEFDREPLMPHMVSTEGPAIAVGDVNGDGLEDVFLGASKARKNALFLQTKAGRFARSAQPALDNDSTFEDVDATWVDVNNDKYPDLVVASGGNEYYGKDEFLLPRVYINDGKGQLSKKADAFSDIFITASCVASFDFTGDGYADLFIGGRAYPYEFGKVPRSYLLENDKTGKFKDVTAAYAPDLQQPGFVTQGKWADIDNDGDQDLLVSLEWDGISAYINDKGKFSRQWITQRKGWWNFLQSVDVDQDGDLDLVAGNLGLNSRLKATEQEPVRMYYNDFDDNGRKETVVTYYLGGREIPFANKDELQRQIPVLKKRYLYAEEFAKASLQDIFTAEKLKGAAVFSADYFSNAILINEGNLKFNLQAMPWQAQLTPYKDAIALQANNDTLPDILLGGNFYDNNIQMGRYDADLGTVLVNMGKGAFTAEPINGKPIKGQVRHIREIMIGGKKAYVLARNNDSTLVLRFAP